MFACVPPPSYAFVLPERLPWPFFDFVRICSWEFSRIRPDWLPSRRSGDCKTILGGQLHRPLIFRPFVIEARPNNNRSSVIFLIIAFQLNKPKNKPLKSNRHQKLELAYRFAISCNPMFPTLGLHLFRCALPRFLYHHHRRLHCSCNREQCSLIHWSDVFDGNGSLTLPWGVDLQHWWLL